jgi:hypothetical protein
MWRSGTGRRPAARYVAVRTRRRSRQADRRPGDQFEHDVGDGALRLEDEGHHAEHQDQDHRGGVVEPGLRLQQAGDASGQRQDAQHREDRCGVSGRHDGAEQKRELPVHPEQHVGTGGGDQRADHHAEGRQRTRRGQDLADVGELGCQAAFDEDHGEPGGADVPGQLHVVEVETETVLAEYDTDEQEEEQAGKSHAGRHARTDDARQQHEATDQQRQIQLVQAHFVPVPGRVISKSVVRPAGCRLQSPRVSVPDATR